MLFYVKRIKGILFNYLGYKKLSPLKTMNKKISIGENVWIDPLHDDVKNQNKPGALCIVGCIGSPLSDNTVIIRPF